MKRWLILVGALLVCWLAYDGWRIEPTIGDAGIVFTGKATTRPVGSTIRVATFNIRRGMGADNRTDLDRTAGNLKGFDFVSLNEVGPDQAKSLGEKLGLNWLDAPTERRWWTTSFGNAQLSNYPVKDWQIIPLPHEAGGYRNYVRTRVDLGGRLLTVIGTHISRRDDRMQQRKIVVDQFLKAPEPAVLMGDFNALATEEPISTLLSTPGVSDAIRAIGSTDSPGRIDWIFVKGLKVINAGSVNDGASDHPMIWAELSTQ